MLYRLLIMTGIAVLLAGAAFAQSFLFALAFAAWAKRLDKALDLLSLVHFGDANKQAILQLRVLWAQSHAGYDFPGSTPPQ